MASVTRKGFFARNMQGKEQPAHNGNPIKKTNPKTNETNQFLVAFGPLNLFFKCHGIHLHENRKQWCRYFSFLFFMLIGCFNYVSQINDTLNERERRKAEITLSFCADIFFTGARLYLLVLAYWSLFFRQTKLQKISGHLSDMALLTIGSSSSLFLTMRKRNKLMICTIYVATCMFAFYYYLLPCYFICFPDMSKVKPALMDIAKVRTAYRCSKCASKGVQMTISHLITLPFEYMVMVLFLQYCYLLAHSFRSMTEIHGLQRFPSRLYPYKAGRYIEYHITHSTVVSYLNDTFRVLVITWHGLECLLIIFAIRQMDLHKTDFTITWEKVVLVVFNILLFAIKSVIPAKVNHQVTVSLKGLTIISTSKENTRIQNINEVYEPIAMIAKESTSFAQGKIKLYIETILTDVPMITGYGMYNLSDELLLEAFSEILTYVIVLYGIPT